LIIIREFAQISALLIGFYLFYLFILFRSVRKHIELRRAIESQITESQELAYPLIQQHLDWVVSGRFEELRRNLNALFNGYWPILSATLSNSFLPTLLLDVSWTILFIGACVWRYLYTGNAFHGDAIFFSIMVFELFKTITALNGNCFKVGETIQLRQSLKEVLERYPRFGTQAGPSRIELLEGRGITVQTPTTTIGKHPIELDIKEGDQELYFSFDRDKTATFIGLIRRQLQPTEGLLKFVPPGAKATVLDPSVSRNYLSTDSLERLRQRTLNSRDQLVVIESLLDNASTEEVITFVRFLRQEKITALVITHNKWHYENIPDFKILI
jgi:ABC-type transport system involved in cytochrome bd biosynthesis fused ATPase/permease subunit